MRPIIRLKNGRKPQSQNGNRNTYKPRFLLTRFQIDKTREEIKLVKRKAPELRPSTKLPNQMRMQTRAARRLHAVQEKLLN